MNRKEFYKKFLYFPIPKQYLDKIWQWIEQYGTEQRIGETQKYYNALTEMYYSKDGNPDDKIILCLRKLFENRMKELKDE